MKNTLGKRLLSGLTSAFLLVSSLNSLLAQAASNYYGENTIDDAVLLAGTPNDGLLVEGDTAATLRNYDNTYLLGIAADFSVFLLEDFEIYESDAEGRTAVGGDIINKVWWEGGQYQIGKGDYVNKTPLDKLLGRSNYADVILGGKLLNNPLGDETYVNGEDFRGENKKKLVINTNEDLSGYDWTYIPEDKDDAVIDRTQTYCVELFDFKTEYKKLYTRSSQLAGGECYQSLEYDEETKTFTFRYTGPTDEPRECVYFNLSEKDFENYANATHINFIDIPDLPERRKVVSNTGEDDWWYKSYIIVNVAGDGSNNPDNEIRISTDINWEEWPNNNQGGNVAASKQTRINGESISDALDGKTNNDPGVTSILYNFYEAKDTTSIVLGGNFQGTIFAPRAHVTDEETLGRTDVSGHLSGALIANSFKGYTEFGYRPFTGGLKLAGAATEYRIGITKYNEDESELLAGATFGIFEAKTDANGDLIRDKNGNVVFNATPSRTVTTSDAEEDFINLTPGKYVLREIDPPPGYALTDREYYLEVVDEVIDVYLKTNPDGTHKILPDETNADTHLELPRITIYIYNDSNFNIGDYIATYTYSAFRAHERTYQVGEDEVKFQFYDRKKGSLLQGVAGMTINGQYYDANSDVFKEEFAKYEFIRAEKWDGTHYREDTDDYEAYVVYYNGSPIFPIVTLTRVIKQDTSNDFKGFVFYDKEAVDVRKVDENGELLEGADIDLANESYLYNGTFTKKDTDFVYDWNWSGSTSYLILEHINDIALENNIYSNIYRLTELEEPLGYEEPIYDTVFVVSRVEGGYYLYTKLVSIGEPITDLPVSYNSGDGTWSENSELITIPDDKTNPKSSTDKWTRIDLSDKVNRVINIENRTAGGYKLTFRKVTQTGAFVKNANISLWHYDPVNGDERIHSWKPFPGEISRNELAALDAEIHSPYIENGYLEPGIYYFVEDEVPEGFKDNLEGEKLAFVVNEDGTVSGYTFGRSETYYFAETPNSNQYYRMYHLIVDDIAMDGSASKRFDNIKKIVIQGKGQLQTNIPNYDGKYVDSGFEITGISSFDLNKFIIQGAEYADSATFYYSDTVSELNPAFDYDDNRNVLSIINESELTVGVSKVDESGNFLPGAEITIYNLTDNREATLTSAEEMMHFSVIAGKEYMIKETKAPAGYKLSDKEYYFMAAEEYAHDYEFVVPVGEKILQPVIYEIGKTYNGELFTADTIAESNGLYVPAEKNKVYNWYNEISSIVYTSTSASGDIIESLTFYYKNNYNKTISNTSGAWNKDIKKNFEGEQDNLLKWLDGLDQNEIVEITATLIQTPSGEETAKIKLFGNSVNAEIEITTSTEGKKTVTLLGGVNRYYKIDNENGAEITDPNTSNPIKVEAKWDYESYETKEFKNKKFTINVYSDKNFSTVIDSAAYDPLAINDNTYLIGEDEYKFTLNDDMIVGIIKNGNVLSDTELQEEIAKFGVIESTDKTAKAILYDGEILYPHFVLTESLENGFEIQNLMLDPSEIEISKKIAGTDNFLPGAKLQLILYAARYSGAVLDAEMCSASDAALYTPDGSILWTTDGGPTKFTGLPDGIYLLKEYDAPDGYRSAEPIRFEIRDGVLVDYDSIVMYDEETSLNIQKVGEKAEDTYGLAGAELKLTLVTPSVDGAELTIAMCDANDAVLDKDGAIVWTSATDRAFFTKLPDGHYRLEEITPPDGYEIASSIEFDIVNGSITNILIVTESGSTYDEDENTFRLFDKLATAPKVAIKKVNEKGEALSGAKFELDKKDGETYKPVEDVSWTSDGTLNDLTLEDGDYRLSETEAPDGYTLADPVYFKVENGEIECSDERLRKDADGNYIFTIEDVLSEIEFSKQGDDTEGAELEGVELMITLIKADEAAATLKNVKNNVKATYSNDPESLKWTSGSEKAKFTGLPDGEYTLEEVTPHEDYTGLSATINFTIENGKITRIDNNDDVKLDIDGTTITVMNHKIQESPEYELPETGGCGTLPYYTAGSAIMGLGLIVLALGNRKRRSNI